MTKTNWNGFRELVVIDKMEVCPSIVSVFFKAKDGGKLPKHIPGQFLPMKIKTDDEKYKEEVRTYSLSMLPNDEVYRISVKKVDGGLISSYIHDELKVGDEILAMVPAGLFTVQSPNSVPLVLISAGIGITPLLSMLYSEAEKREKISFIQAVQNSSLHPFKMDIEYFAGKKGVTNTVFYSNPLEGDVEGRDYNNLGFVSKDYLENNVDLSADFYFCGPPPFMKAVEKSLQELGVPNERIHFELFS